MRCADGYFSQITGQIGFGRANFVSISGLNLFCQVEFRLFSGLNLFRQVEFGMVCSAKPVLVGLNQLFFRAKPI